MGFSDKNKNIEALKATNGNINLSIERIINKLS